MVSSFILLCSENRKIVDNNTNQHGKEYLKGDYDVDVFEYREPTHPKFSLAALFVLEQIAWEAPNHLISYKIDKTEATELDWNLLLQAVAISIGLFLEAEIEKNTEVVFNEEKGNEG